jgi:heterodisulfide reductase subunit A-like polyferredoxin
MNVLIFSVLLPFFYMLPIKSLSSITKPKVVIIGGGIHGATTSYYLSQRGYQPVIIEKTNIASAASGKSGKYNEVLSCMLFALIPRAWSTDDYDKRFPIESNLLLSFAKVDF